MCVRGGGGTLWNGIMADERRTASEAPAGRGYKHQGEVGPHAMGSYRGSLYSAVENVAVSPPTAYE